MIFGRGKGKLVIPGKNQCGNCHAFLEKDDEYCRKCGTKRGEGDFLPYENYETCVYGPPPEERDHICENCGFSWTNCVMLDKERYCPKCGKPVKVVEKGRERMKRKIIQNDVVALGELLIDFTENGTSAQGNPLMEANPGGAPCNVLAMLTKLGHKTTFVGKVGEDVFGYQLKDVLEEVGIGTKGLKLDAEVHTTLAIVHKLPNGDRDFSFYRNPGADMMLSEEDVDEELIKSAKIFHFGSLSMTSEPVKSATMKALGIAKDEGIIISFDPNLREPLWPSLEDAKREIAFGMSMCDILKISDNEITWFTGIDDYDEAVVKLFEDYPDIRMILLSKGPEGSCCYQKERHVTVKPFLQENTIETTGAGDTFCAGVLHYVLEHGLKDYDESEMTDMLTFANAAASIITTKRGALRVMPEAEEVEALVATRQTD